jgi:threonine dehydratase
MRSASPGPRTGPASPPPSSSVPVTEKQIADAIGYLALEHGLIAEGAGAAPVAAILAGTIPVTGQTVAIISGRNITLQTLAQVLQNR